MKKKIEFSDQAKKIIILGWDGATFKILDEMVERGLMPNLEKVIKNGIKSVLLSTIPPITGPAWTSFNTGRKPEGHGVFSFFKSPSESLDILDIERHDARSIDGLSYWNILNHSGKKCIIVDFPLTDPVEAIDGLMISGMSSRGRRKALIYPESVNKEIEKKFNDNFEKSITDGISVSESYLNHLIRSLEEKSELDLYLIRNNQWDLFSTLYSAVDTLQHYFWKYIDPSSIQYTGNQGIKKKIDEFFVKLDEILGKYCDELGDEGNLIIASDHGFGPRNYIFYVNNFLLKNGYLFLERKNVSRAKFKYILKKVLYKVDLFDFKRFVTKETRVKINKSLQPLAKIKWEYSKAGFRSNNEYGVYINRKGKYPGGIVEDGEYKSVLDSLIKGFLSERNNYSGANIFEKVLPGASVYTGGKYSADAPDIVLIPEKGVTLGGFNYSDLNLVLEENSALLSGFHEPEGVFLGYGPAFKNGCVITDPLFIYDIAPMILHIAGIEPLTDMDGNIVEGILGDDNVLRKKIRSSDIKKKFIGVDDFNDLETIEALRGLGYLD